MKETLPMSTKMNWQQLLSSSGSNIWSGPLTRIGQTRINTASGSTLVMTGGATGGGSLFVVNAGGTFVLAEKPEMSIGSTTVNRGRFVRSHDALICPVPNVGSMLQTD